MSSPRLRVFVSYSHQDAKYLKRTSLLGYLKGLEEEGVEFWTDCRIATGDIWDDEIKAKIAASHLALVLVSQAFLDSAYCEEVEVATFIDRELPIFPILLSPCEWKRHDWLSQRQFLPSGDKTIEEHFTASGRRKRLFLDIRQELRQQLEQIRKILPTAPCTVPPNPFTYHMEIRDPFAFVGRKAELSRARQLLSGGSLVIIGERKVGKSSLARKLASDWGASGVVGPINIHALESPDDFYDDLAHRLGLKSGEWSPLRATLLGRRLLLVIDELDDAPDVGLDTSHLLRFRALCSENTDLKMIAVAHQPLREIFPVARGSFPYDFLQPLQLGEMTSDDARHLLTHPWAPAALPFDQSSIDELLTLAGRHPFKLQRAAFHRYENLCDSAYEWRAAWRCDIEQML